MKDLILADVSEDLKPVWREYWGRHWDRLKGWSGIRLSGFMDADVGRKAEYLPTSHDSQNPTAQPQIQSPIVFDHPDHRGPFIGVITKPLESSGVIQFNDPGHLLTIAPTRTGKGTSQIIPNLLLYAGSVVVIDIKGENAALTSTYRAEMFNGASVFKFAPFSDETAQYNPLDFIRSKQEGGATLDTFDDARLVANMLIPGNSREPYWDIEARNLATMILLYVAMANPRDSTDRNMTEVSRLLFRSDRIDDESGIQLTLDEIFHYARADDYQPLLSLVSSFRDHDKRLRDNIVSTCHAEMRIWTSPRLQNATQRSDFFFSDLKKTMCRPVDQNPAPTSLYIIIPPEYLQSYRAVLRLMIGLGTIELTRSPEWKEQEGWTARPPCPVLFLLDELPALGHMDPIVTGLSYLAGYDVQLWSFAQNIGQLKEIYGEAWHNFPANSAVTCFFGVNDLETAEFVSRQLGESEEHKHEYLTLSMSRSESSTLGDQSSSYNTGDSRSVTGNVRFIKEPLATPAHVRSTHKDLQYVFVRNRPPILATKLEYYNFPLFKNLYGEWRP